MKAIVLLSEGRHPVSRRAMLPAVEARALRLAEAAIASVPGAVIEGLHAGPSAEVVGDAFGHGLSRLVHLVLPEGDDPVPALIAALGADVPDLIVAGEISRGGEETGMVPHLLAAALDRPIVGPAIAVRPGDRAGTWVVDEALPRGARRRVTVAGPVVVTVAETAPVARPFAHGRRAAGRIETRPAAVLVPTVADGIEERPHKHRPRLIVAAETRETRLLVDPTPEEAARAVLDHLAALGLGRRPTPEASAADPGEGRRAIQVRGGTGAG